MNRLVILSLCVFQGLLYGRMASAYEVKTHEDISEHALNNSVLKKDPSFLQQQLGITSAQQFPDANGTGRTILQLLRYGANQEDNLYIPAVGGSRFMHHFYDPVHNIPLTDFTPFNLEFVSLRYGVPYQPIQKSPTWALEDNGDFLDNKYAGQIFSYKDSRGYFFKALTEFSKIERDKYFGLTFQTLGHIIHHIQDMAQPQHVKNEQHPPIAPSSLYEHYTELKEVRESLLFTGYAAVDSLNGDQPTFDTPRKFWLTSNGTGKGLAEFTNSNFVTYGHNFTGTLDQPQPNPVYPNPKPAFPTEISIINLPLAPQVGLDQAALDGKMYFIKAPVTDAYRPGESRMNNLASAFSLYDDDLTRWNIQLDCPPGSIIDPSVQCTQQAVFTVNRFTMSAAHDFLIPRAVGYSAGLINYFFRGKLSVDSQTQPGRLVVKNEGPDTLSGHFTLYYDGAEDRRYAVVPDPANSIGATPWPTPTEGLLPGQTITLPAFTPPPSGLRPMPKTPGEYMLVFQGTIGQEQGIAVAAKKVQGSVPPSFLTPVGRLQYTTSGWQVRPDTTLQYGNVDWQGPTPEDVVTWIGPRGRLMNKLLVTQLSNKIFQHGSVLVEAPGPVLGAALSTQSKLGLGNSDQKMVVAVIAVTEPGGDAIVGYDPQANTPVYSPQPIVVRDDVYVKPVDAASSQGWQLIGSYEYPSIDYYRSPLQSSRPDHWFFNADGNAAVCNKLTQTAFITGGIRRPYRPIKLTVSSGSAAFTDIAESDPELMQTSAAETLTLTDAYVDYKGNEIVKLSITVSISASDDATSFTKDMTLARLGRTYTLVDYASAAGDWRSQWNIEHIDLRTGLIAYRDIHLDVQQGGFSTSMQVYYITPDGSQVLVGSPSLSDEYYLSWAHLAYAYIDASAFLLNGNSFNGIANLGESLPEEIFDPERGVGSVAVRIPLNSSTSQDSGQAIISQSVVDFSTPVLQKTSLIPPTGALPGGLGDFITPIGIE